MDPVTITLPSDLAESVRTAVDGGESRRASEAVRAADVRGPGGTVARRATPLRIVAEDCLGTLMAESARAAGRARLATRQVKHEARARSRC